MIRPTTNKNALLQLNDDLQDKFITFVHNRFGIVIKKDHKELLKLINEYCTKNQYTPFEYLTECERADENSEIINRLVATITIGETYFFRDKRQVKLLQEYVLPEMIRHKHARSEKTLRIWSAGCSSGEEIYTIIMLLKDLNVNMNEWQCYFLATDINIDMLRKAMSGKYSEWSMRSIPEFYLSKYFKKEGNVYQLDNNIRKLVNFDYLNLNTECYPSIMNGTSAQDLIICRNVLIYFDNDHIKRILQRLTKSIADDGYIMLGASDPIALMEAGVKSVQECPSLFSKSKTQPKPEAHIPTIVTQQIEVVAKQSVKSTIVEQESTDILLEKAFALANRGENVDAVKICEQVIDLDKMNKEAYFIYALSLSELKRFKEAEAAFRKALYIDPGYLICRYQFGIFLIHHKRQQEGLKALQVTVKTASQFKDDDIVPDSNNMRYKEFVAVLKNEIQLYE